MKNRVIFFCIAVMAILGYANELDDLLKDKEVEYAGVCRFDSKGVLVFEDKQTAVVQKCVVGHDVGETNIKVILLFDKICAVKLVEYTISTKSQRTLWVRGSI